MTSVVRPLADSRTRWRPGSGLACLSLAILTSALVGMLCLPARGADVDPHRAPPRLAVVGLMAMPLVAADFTGVSTNNFALDLGGTQQMEFV